MPLYVELLINVCMGSNKRRNYSYVRNENQSFVVPKYFPLVFRGMLPPGVDD